MKSARHAFLALLLFAAQRAEAQEAAPPAPASAQEPGSPAPDTAGTPVSSAPPATVEAPASGTTNAADTQQTADDPAATAPAGEAHVQLTDAELAALGLSVEDQGLDTDLHFSGFMDVNMLQVLNPEEVPVSARSQGTEASFFVGRLNLYATKNITESFRMMAEVRFMYAPNGAEPLFGTAGPASTEVIDPAGTSGSVRWGGIMIERAYGEWSPFSFLSLRLGAFLTPYGIWNVDHGSPVFIPVMRPYAVNGAFFPERQTGLEAFGRVGLSSNLALRYHLTLSNGLGPVSEYRDLDSNKAVGGRLALEYAGAGQFQVGGSAFYGESTGANVGIGVNSDATGLKLDKVITDQGYVTAVAADVLWKYRGLHLQGEWVGQRWQYTRQGRTPAMAAGQAGVPADALLADTFNWAGYFLAGYRLPWWGIMPFGTLEYQRSNNWGIVTASTFTQMGLNIRPADAIVLKLEYQWVFGGTEETRAKVLAAQLAWAF